MEKLKQLIKEQRYIEAKEHILDNREEIEDIADTLLGMIDEFQQKDIEHSERKWSVVMDDGTRLKKLDGKPSFEGVYTVHGEAGKRLKESIESIRAGVVNPIEYHLRYIEEEFKRKTLEYFDLKYVYREVQDEFLVNFSIDGIRVLSLYRVKEEDIKNRDFSIVDDLIRLARMQ